MASIIARTRADGTKSYRADIRIKRKGRLVYQESRTFDRKALAKDWAARRELELQEPGAIDRVRHRGVTIGDLIERYQLEFGANFGRSKASHLEYMLTFDLAKLDALELQTKDIVTHIMGRLQHVKPQTANNDIIWLRSVFKVARTAWGMPVDLNVINDAAETCRRERLVAKPDSRDRRPTLEELNKLMEYADRPSGKRSIPMGEIILFALFSGRRQEEITRIRWDGLDEKNRTVIVSDMKHPTAKRGNHKRVYLTDEAWTIIQRQPKRGDRIFPDNSKSIGTRFREWCKFLGIDDLRFHDLRHECISWLFERGWDIPRVASVSGHTTWSTLQRYTHLSKQEPHDKYDGWVWRPN
ncbi:tyrosine-type recombinase/integrase [Marinobacter koreensis]|uniref:Tyrosine-type recombinase/integrase n=1 Tax=Marinobacter koreensis TaxID=335974 RepID=A0ABW0RLF8_9GAMM|nr:site-specific integrase [Marinobacter koreensis]